MSYIFTLNGGSSSIKFSIFEIGAQLTECASGLVEELGSDSGNLIFEMGDKKSEHALGKVDHMGAIEAIRDTVTPVLEGANIVGVGHRIVHGGPDIDAPVRLDDGVLKKLESYVPFAPLHQPYNLAGVRAAIHYIPDACQVGCFDTAFHRGHPWVNDAYALPREYYDTGVRRYGFHGLSYTYISRQLEQIDSGHHGRTIVIHLGNGASMCAIKDGKSVASTMGFSALDGLAMGTRCGQVDPGVLLYMLDQQGLSSKEITNILYKKSGLLGMSGISSDMRTLQSSDAPEAKEAIDYFVFRIRRELGAMTSILNGLDTVVFCGGIGENSAPIRERVCEDMGWLGIELDTEANKRGAPVISKGKVTVRVIPTNEELVIAEAVAGMI